MNKYALGKQKTLAELCEKKDERIKEQNDRIIDLSAKLDQTIDMLDLHQRAFLLNKWGKGE